MYVYKAVREINGRFFSYCTKGDYEIEYIIRKKVIEKPNTIGIFVFNYLIWAQNFISDKDIILKCLVNIKNKKTIPNKIATYTHNLDLYYAKIDTGVDCIPGTMLFSSIKPIKILTLKTLDSKH